MPWGFDSIQFSVKLPQDPWKIQFDLGIIPNFSLIIVAACEFFGPLQTIGLERVHMCVSVSFNP